MAKIKRWNVRCKSKKAKGFSGSGQRQMWNFLLRGARVQRHEKREVLNQFALCMIFGAGVTGSIVGYSWRGVFGEVLGLVVFTFLMSRFVGDGRYFR